MVLDKLLDAFIGLLERVLPAVVWGLILGKMAELHKKQILAELGREYAENALKVHNDNILKSDSTVVRDAIREVRGTPTGDK